MMSFQQGGPFIFRRFDADRAFDAELRSAGWTEGRTVEVREWGIHYREQGVFLHDRARAFLREFGGLTIGSSGRGRRHARVSVEVDPLLCDGMYECDRVEGAGGPTFPLGEVDAGDAVISMAESGDVFMLWDFASSYMGNGRDALKAMVLGLY